MKLKFCFHNNPRVAPLLDGSVKIEGVDCDWQEMDPGEAFMHHLMHNGFDAFDLSISHYTSTRWHPNQAYQGWALIPVFASKPVFMYGTCSS
jgi:hypothetical protein